MNVRNDPDLFGDNTGMDPKELADLVVANLLSARSNGDPESFEMLTQVAFEMLNAGMLEQSAMIVHELMSIISVLETGPRFDGWRWMELLASDAEVQISPKWPSALATRIFYLAGQVALTASAWTTAERFLLRSVELAGPSHDQLDIGLYYQALSGAQSELGDPKAAIHSTMRSLDIFREIRDLGRTTEVLLNLAQNYLTMGEAAKATESLNDAESLTLQMNNGHLNAAVLALRASIEIESSHFKNAEVLLRKALASARRRGDRRQEQQIVQNLSNVIEETAGHAQGIRWRIKALAIAIDRQDPHGQATLERSIGISWSRAGRLGEALKYLNRAVGSAESCDEKYLQGQCLADLGAVQLAHSTGVALTFSDSDEDVTPDAPHAPEPDREGPDIAQFQKMALQNLNTALEIFVVLKNSEWIQRVALNRGNLLRREDGTMAVQGLVSLGEEVSAFDQILAAELVQEAARIECQNGVDPEETLRLYLASIEIRGEQEESKVAWNLSQAAAEMSDFASFYDEAVLLLERAEQIYSKLGETQSASKVANDRALALAHAGKPEEALTILRGVQDLAEEEKNRVLLEMALNNLGEICARNDRTDEAVTYLALAADLATEIGDHGAAAQHWGRVSGLLLGDDAKSEVALSKARESSFEDGGAEANAAVMSAEASKAFQDGSYSEAAKLWVDASLATSGRRSVERASFALHAYAKAGGSSEYSTWLQRFVDLAQKEDLRQQGAESLWPAAIAWLNEGKPHEAADGLGAAAILASVELLDQSSRVDFSRYTGKNRLPGPLLSFYGSMSTIAHILAMEEVPRGIRHESREIMIRDWRKDQPQDLVAFLIARLEEAEESLVDKAAE